MGSSSSFQLYLWGLPFVVFFVCVPSCISGVHSSSSSSSAFPAVFLGFNNCLLLLLRSQLYLWGLPFVVFFFFCVPSCISGVYHSSSSFSPALPVVFWGVHHSSSTSSIALGFTILLLLLPSYSSGVHHSSSSSVFLDTSLRFTIVLLRSQLYLLGSTFFFFFLCVPSFMSGLYHSSSSTFPAISLGFTILLLLLRSQLYLWGSPVLVRLLHM